jgi:hypothetical protein
MEKFWKWMSANGNARLYGTQWNLLVGNFIVENKNTMKRLLIGFMIEYCVSKGNYIGVSNKVMEKHNIELYFDELKSHIEFIS